MSRFKIFSSAVLALTFILDGSSAFAFEVAQADEQSDLQRSLDQKEQQPAPAPPAGNPLATDIGGATVEPTYDPAGGKITVPCGPNIQGGRVVCN